MQSVSSSKASQPANNKTDATIAISQQTVAAPDEEIDKNSRSAKMFEQPESQLYLKPSLVDAKFLDMKVQLEHILGAISPQIIYEQCKKLMASHEHDIALFSSEYLNDLKGCSLTQQLLQKLSPLFKWSDHSVLSAIVKACDKPEAATLLQQFDKQVDLSIPITEYPVPKPVPSMAPYDTSMQTVLAVKLNIELSKFSLQHVCKLRCLIQEKFQITEHSLQLMAAKSNPNVLYWMIPKCVSHLISSKIIENVNLPGSRIEEISIYPGTLFVSASDLKIGSLAFLSQMVS